MFDWVRVQGTSTVLARLTIAPTDSCCKFCQIIEPTLNISIIYMTLFGEGLTEIK